ncbi:hypothetical protein N9C56_03435 [Paracoccaceae bacterium]|nr:hypothetical protein [Paracoccaceae bacterium]
MRLTGMRKGWSNLLVALAGQEKVCGGGNFDYPCWGTRTTDRGHHLPVHRSLGLGFIIAQDF